MGKRTDFLPPLVLAVGVAILGCAVFSGKASFPLSVSESRLTDPPRHENVLDAHGFMRAVAVSPNQIAFRDEFRGKPIAMNVDFVAAGIQGDGLIVTMNAYVHSASPTLTSLNRASGHLVSCRFDASAGTRPLSGWMPRQDILLRGILGDDAASMEGCILSAYVNREGLPAGGSSLTDIANGQVRRLDPSQVFPPQG